MKTLLIIFLLILSASAFAEDKNITCATQIDGVQSPLVTANLTKSNPRLELGTIDGISFSATKDSSSSILTLNIINLQTREVFDAHGSFGKNGEGVVLSIPQNGKRFAIICVIPRN